MSWNVIGASVAGTSHVKDDKGCDDAHNYVVAGLNNLIICVSDGAGSASRSAMAAEFCCSVMLQQLCAKWSSVLQLTAEHVYAAIEEVVAGLHQLASEQQLPIEEFSCTLLGVILADEYSLFFHLGDGAIVRSADDGILHCVSWPQNGEYANTTYFVTDELALANLKVIEIPEATNEVAIFTDGLQMLALNMEQQTVHQPFFTGMLHHLRQARGERLEQLQTMLADYLNSKAINQRTDDDKTLVLAVRH